MASQFLGRRIERWLQVARTAIAVFTLFGLNLSTNQVAAIILLLEAILALAGTERARRRRVRSGSRQPSRPSGFELPGP